MADDRRRLQAWRTGNGRPTAPIPGTKKPGGGKRFAAIAIILAVVGVIGGIFYFMRKLPTPLFVGIAITQYADRSIPPNPWAQQDSEALTQHFPGDSASAFQAQQKKELVDLLVQLADKTGTSSDRNRPVVVHLSAHGVTRDGKVYLLPGRAEPGQRNSWLPLEDVLAALKRGSGPRLLLLDLAHPVTDAHAGLLTTEVSEVLHSELEREDKAGNLPFFVLTSCGKGEAAYAPVELRRSVFGFFVEQALLGHADNWGAAGKSDGRISASELIEYVRVQVAHWSAGQRLGPQNPTLFGQGKDFILISPPQPVPPMAAPEALPEYPKWLQDGWTERDNWRAAEAFRIVPRTFRELESELLQAERRWLAGIDEEIIKKEFEGKLADLKAQRAKLTPQPFVPKSLAQMRRIATGDDQPVTAAIAPLLDRIKSKVPLKPDDFKPLMEKPPEPAPYASIAFRTLAAAIEPAELTAEQLKDFDAFLSVFSPRPRFIELAALRFLMDAPPRTQENWSERDMIGTRRLILRAARSSEEAAAIDPRALPWLSADLAEADRKHREGIEQVTTGSLSGRAEGKKKLQEAIDAFDQIARSALVLERGFQQLEEARVLLPALAQSFSQRVPELADERLWETLINHTQQLQQILTPPTKPTPPPLQNIESIAAQMLFAFNNARAYFQADELERQLRRIGKDNGPTASDLRRLLDAPLWSAPNRVKLFNAIRELGQTSVSEGISAASNLPRGTTPPAPLASRPDSPAWRAKLAIDLLRLDGVTDIAPLDKARAKAARTNEIADWHALADELRRAWAETLPEKYRGLSDLAAQERAAFALHHVDLSALPDAIDKPPVEPTPELRKRQASEFWRWLARERYQKAAELFQKHTGREDLRTYGAEMDQMRLELQTGAP